MSTRGEADDVARRSAGGEIARVAADWVARSDRGLSEREKRDLHAWQAEEPLHAAEFARARAAWTGMDRLGASPQLAALADDFLERARARRRQRRLARAGGLAAAAAAVVLLGIALWPRLTNSAEEPMRTGGENYRVLASTLRRQLLPDGSVAELNGASRIEVNYSAGTRRVRLVDGEAHFVVAPNPDRPFFVTAGPVTVRAVGTAFNVRLAAEKVEVLVTEGRVKLEREEPSPAAPPRESATEAAPALSAGHRAVISRNPEAAAVPVAIKPVDRAEIDETLGWQGTRLVFNNTPLDEVVEGFNRHNSQRLVLGDTKLRQRALTGTFRADNLDGFVRLLKASVDVKAERRTPTETVLLPVR